MSDEPFLPASDLVAHNLIEWQEAVAVVQAVCDRLTNDGGGVPELDRIGILSTGEVVLRPTATSTDAPTRLLGYRLTALLERSNPPAPLRLFASQVTASSPLYGSLDDFSRGLAYFGRPDRSSILQDVYKRAMPALAARPMVTAARQSERPAAPSPAELQRQHATTRRRRLVFGAMAILVVSAASVAAWRRFDIGTTSSKLLSRTTASTAKIVHTGVSSGIDFLKKVGLVSAPRVVPPPETTTKASLARARRVPEPAPIESEAVAESSAFVPAAGSSPTPTDLSVTGSTRVPTNSDLISTGQEATSPDDLRVDSRIYTADDADVSLPILSSLSARELPALPSDTSGASSSAAGVIVVDLLINERGTVDSVKFVTPPTDMRQRMLISALKAWRYQPALKDGRPVRFLHRVRLAS